MVVFIGFFICFIWNGKLLVFILKEIVFKDKKVEVGLVYKFVRKRML